jgi:hypothetical protein
VAWRATSASKATCRICHNECSLCSASPVVKPAFHDKILRSYEMACPARNFNRLLSAAKRLTVPFQRQGCFATIALKFPSRSESPFAVAFVNGSIRNITALFPTRLPTQASCASTLGPEKPVARPGVTNDGFTEHVRGPGEEGQHQAGKRPEAFVLPRRNSITCPRGRAISGGDTQIFSGFIATFGPVAVGGRTL